MSRLPWSSSPRTYSCPPVERIRGSAQDLAKVRREEQASAWYRIGEATPGDVVDHGALPPHYLTTRGGMLVPTADGRARARSLGVDIIALMVWSWRRRVDRRGSSLVELAAGLNVSTQSVRAASRRIKYMLAIRKNWRRAH